MSSVDIFVPCYAYGHFLRECVESVLAQWGVDVRVLIIDDASPDNTAEVAVDLVKNDARVHFRRHLTNKGHIATYNEGIEWASSDYMLLLSADDYLLPGALDRAARLMDTHEEVGLVCGKGLELTEDCGERPIISRQNPDGPQWRIFKGGDFIRLSAARNLVSTPTAVVRTALQKHIGGYRRELPHSGDMEMWFRFAAHAYVGMTEAYQAVYRRHSENMSLAYTVKGHLPDLRQRRLALDYFFGACGHLLANRDALQEEAFLALSRHAVQSASAAFNQRSEEISSQLVAFAVETCPKVTSSLEWRKFCCKRLIGARAWFALQPLVKKARVRRANLCGARVRFPR